VKKLVWYIVSYIVSDSPYHLYDRKIQILFHYKRILFDYLSVNNFLVRIIYLALLDLHFYTL